MALETMPPVLAHLRALTGVIHFHMWAGAHPSARAQESGVECIELMTGGRGWVEIDGAWTELRPGDLLWHSEGERTIGRSDFTDPYRCLAVRVQVVPGSPRPVARLTRWEDLAELRAFTREAVALWADQRIPRETLLLHVYGSLLLKAQRHVVTRRDPALPESLARTLVRLERDHAQPLDVPALALESGWSPRQLHERFRRHLGTSPHAWLMQRRLRAAREHLAASDAPLAAIARASGFSSSATLCRAFRAATGLSPGAWREQQR